jgi:hypothetical protein
MKRTLLFALALIAAAPVAGVAQSPYTMPHAQAMEGTRIAVADLIFRVYNELRMPSVRSWPTYPGGTPFELISCDAGWCYVSAENGERGYVLRDELKTEDEPFDEALRRLDKAGYHTIPDGDLIGNEQVLESLHHGPHIRKMCASTRISERRRV